MRVEIMKRDQRELLFFFFFPKGEGGKRQFHLDNTHIIYMVYIYDIVNGGKQAKSVLHIQIDLIK